MQDHWEAFGPPVYIPVASYFGLNKGKRKQKANPMGRQPDGKYETGNLEELAALFGASGGVIQ